MLRSYSCWVAIISWVFFHIVAFVKCIKDIPGDVSFVITEGILVILFYVGAMFCLWENKK